MVNPKNVHSIIGKHMLADGMEQVIDLNKSHGSWLIDARDGKEYLDVTRSEKMANVFDMYYDKYGAGSIKSINYGCGTIRPNLWNVKPPERKKRKRRLKEDE